MQSSAKRERHGKRVCARERESARLAPAAEVNGKLQFSRHFTLHPLRLSCAATATPAANKRWGWSAAKRASEQRERERKRGGEPERNRVRERESESAPRT